MTDQMTVQAQRPSALPYLATGALAGGGAGYFLADTPVGIKGKAYSSWEDAIKDASKEDAFVKSKAEGTDDVAKNWKTVLDQRKAVADAEKALAEYKLPEGFNAKAELDALIEKEIAKETAEKTLKTKAFDEALAELKKMEIKPDAPYEFNGKSYTQEELRNLLNSTKDDDKKIVKELVESHDLYKNRIDVNNKEFLKAEKEAIETATKDFQTATEAFNKKDTANKITNEIRTKYTELKKGINGAKETAKETLTDDVLKNLKKGNKWMTAAAGAVLLGLAALALRPGAKEA